MRLVHTCSEGFVADFVSLLLVGDSEGLGRRR